MTQRQLAGGTLSVSYISLLEAGRRSPTPETVQRLARALDCSVEELLGDEDNIATRPPGLNLRYGQLALEAGDVAQAQDHLAAVLGSEKSDPLVRGEAVIGMATILEVQGQLREAAEMYEYLMQEGVQAPSYHCSLQVVNRWCRCLFELGEYARVVEVGGGAWQELGRLNAWQSHSAIQLLATVGAAYLELGQPSQAELTLRDGLRRIERVRSDRARASLLAAASHTASGDGRHRLAWELADEAWASLRHAARRREVGRVLSQYGMLLLRQEPPLAEQAERLFEQGLHMLAEDGHGRDRACILTELARLRLMRQDEEGAIERAERALTEVGAEATLERVRAEAVLAAALATSGSQSRAAELFEAAAGTLQGMGASRQAARAWVDLGNLLDLAGDPHGAVKAFRRATAAVHISVEPSGNQPDRQVQRRS
jgi:transcriptional regulator with XRE-family HTH domain